jgi:hypothetical protein
MANFIRRFLFDPGVETLLEIESVNILDLEPPAQITGVGAGTVLMVGEFENGPFSQYEVTGATDFKNTLGSFGYEYDGVPGNNPSARERSADLALSPENWNGNGFAALANKKFRRLILLRVDTNTGEVTFTRLAAVLGGTAQTFTLVSGQQLSFDPAGSGVVNATFTGVVASTTSAAGVYPTTFTGGETMNVTIDDGITGSQIGPVDIIFQAADQLQVDVIARINAVLGYTAASDAGAGVTDLDGRIGGTGGNVKINSIDAAVATATGFSAGTDVGTGTVVNIEAVTEAEVNTAVNTADTDSYVERDADGKLRLYYADILAANQTIAVDAATTAVNLGFTIGDSHDATLEADNVDMTIPAGTRVRNGSAVEWVTMQDIAVTADSEGPYTVKVRHADDDTTGLGSIVGSVTVIPFPIRYSAFAVDNAAPITAALTEAQLDAAYVAAIQSTKSLTQAGKEANVILAARQSNIVRTALRDSALEASAEGAYGRMAMIRPPLGTLRATARAAAQPGVGAYRDQRVAYCFPGVQTYLSQIAFQGTAGGSGFSSDGIIDVGFDAFVASVLSQLPPEENPGQITTFLNGVLGLEAGNDDVQDMTIGDYTLFRASGIAAPRQSINTGTFVIQSGVTSVNPATNPNLRNIARRRMADFIQDSLALRATAFGKQLSTRSRRAAILSEFRAFMSDLVDEERLDSQSVVVGSDAAEIAAGLYRLRIKGRTLASLDSIVLESTIGESVTIDEI